VDFLVQNRYHQYMIHRLLSHLKPAKLAWFERHFIPTLLIGAVVAMLFSLLIGLRQSVWFDEAYSIMLAKQSWSHLIYLTSIDTHPPLYYLLLKAWAMVFGWGEPALRSLSILAAGGAVVFAGLLARRMFGVRVALIALAFVVLAPFLIRYGFEIRMYSLGSLIGIAATYVLVRAVGTKDKQQAWRLYGTYAVLVALGVYTLYYTALLWIAHLAWLLWVTYKHRQRLLDAPWLLSYVGAVVLFLPWLSTFLKQMGNGALAPIAQAMTLENLLGIVSFSFVYQPVWQLNAAMSLIVLFVLIMIGYLSVMAFKRVKAGQRAYLVLLALYVLVPIAILSVVGFMRPMYVERYLAHIMIGGILFVGVSAALVYPKASQMVRVLIITLGGVLVIGVAQLVLVGNFNFQRLQSPQIKQAAATISCTDGAAVLAADPYVAIELAYYLPSCPVRFYGETAKLGGGYAPLSDSVLHTSNPDIDLKDARAVYYVYYDQPKLTMPADLILDRKTTYGPLTVDLFTVE
jgi:uncharacterized membrane protein